MILLKMLQDWSGQKEGSFMYFDELEARILIREGIAETLDGSMPAAT